MASRFDIWSGHTYRFGTIWHNCLFCPCWIQQLLTKCSQNHIWPLRKEKHTSRITFYASSKLIHICRIHFNRSNIWRSEWLNITSILHIECDFPFSSTPKTSQCPKQRSFSTAARSYYLLRHSANILAYLSTQYTSSKIWIYKSGY